MKDYVIDDGVFRQKREAISLKRGDVVDYKGATFKNIKEILINEERNDEGELIIFLISESGKEVAYIRIFEKFEIIHEGSISYTYDGELTGEKSRIIKIIDHDSNANL